MRVLHVISGIAPQSGGPTRSVKGICRALSQAGIDVSLLVLSGNHVFDSPCGVNVIYGLTKKFLKSNLRQFDVVHIQGLWDLRLHFVAKSCRRNNIPYIISPRGMLDPWALSVKKIKKLIALLLYQRKDLEGAIAFHVTAGLEEKSVRDQGLKQPCIIAPNGVTLPLKMPEPHRGGLIKTALFLSRIHPGKGLLTLADAWAKVGIVGWQMKIVGPDSYGHKSEVKLKLESLGISNQWLFVDEINDTEKWVEFRNANLLVHPSISENFGITIVEGLAAGLPVIATKGAPWQDLQTYNCGWWIDQGVDALAEALCEAMSMSDAERIKMGNNGVNLIRDKYQWPAIAKTLISGYIQVLGRR